MVHNLFEEKLDDTRRSYPDEQKKKPPMLSSCLDHLPSSPFLCDSKKKKENWTKYPRRYQFRFVSAEMVEIFRFAQWSEPKYPSEKFRPKFRSISNISALFWSISAKSFILFFFLKKKKDK